MAEHQLGGLRSFGRHGCLRRLSTAIHEKRVPAVFERTRLRRLHLDPPRLLARRIAPGVLLSRADQSKVARPQQISLVSDFDNWVPAQDIEALFKRMQVRPDHSLGIKRANSDAHMHRAHVVIDVGGAPETAAVLLIRPGRLRPGCLNARGMVHRLTLNSTFLQRNKLANLAASGLHKHHFSEQNHDLPSGIFCRNEAQSARFPFAKFVI